MNRVLGKNSQEIWGVMAFSVIRFIYFVLGDRGMGMGKISFLDFEFLVIGLRCFYLWCQSRMCVTIISYTCTVAVSVISYVPLFSRMFLSLFAVVNVCHYNQLYVLSLFTVANGTM